MTIRVSAAVLDMPRSMMIPANPKSAPKPTDKHSWRMEVSTMVLCLSAVVTSTVLLIHADGRPLTDYNFFISFNTLISILAAVARATLAFAVGSCLGQWKWNWFSKRSDTLIVFGSFEDASRGPLGSFWLLCRLRARYVDERKPKSLTPLLMLVVPLSEAGRAFVTLLMLGFEPFMQALIYYQGRLVTTQPRTAPSIGVSNRLDIGSYKLVREQEAASFTFQNQSFLYIKGQFRSEASAGLASAVYRGFYANDPRDAVSFTCSTGNCTWPIFTSLSVCSSCNDVSDQVQVKEQDGKDLGTIHVNATHLEGHFITKALPYVELANPATVTYVDMVARRDIVSDEPISNAYMSAKLLNNQGNTLTFGKLNTMIMACALYFCTNAYKSEVSDGQLKEDIVASWSDRVVNSYSPQEPIRDNWNAYEDYTNHSLDNGHAAYRLSDLQLQIPRAEADRYKLPENVTLLFNITQSTIGSTLSFLQDFLREPLVYGESVSDSIVSKTLYDSANLSETFAGAARAMSIWIRDNSNLTTEGDQQEWVLHIRVRWPFVTLPVLVVFMGCGFVFLSMWETRRLQLPPWKTDMLATLAHYLDASTREQLRAAALQGRAREEAKGMVLNFEDTGKGLELKADAERSNRELDELQNA
ncbi:hypothetical protein PG997_009207 [Apiospora hydei]|uniref:Uncharacterized protein n=1 Tax=Apiospora hydei TaxID=1337664 RepID=A0ABR1VTF3_9PEZI